jgi:hypothetical protein
MDWSLAMEEGILKRTVDYFLCAAGALRPQLVTWLLSELKLSLPGFEQMLK